MAYGRFFSRALGNRCSKEKVCQVALSMTYTTGTWHHDDVIKWKHFPRYWPFVRGIHRSPVNSPHKGQWRGVLMFSLICTRINGWVNNSEAGDLRRHRAHYDVTVMIYNIEDTRRIWSRCLTCVLFMICLMSTVHSNRNRNISNI